MGGALTAPHMAIDGAGSRSRRGGALSAAASGQHGGHGESRADGRRRDRHRDRHGDRGGGAEPSGASGGYPRAPQGLDDVEGTFNQALRVVDQASSFNERALRCAIVVLDSQMSGRAEYEIVLSRLCAWLAPPTPSQAQAFCVVAGLPGCVMRALRRFRGEPPTAALACVAAVRSSGTQEGVTAYLRAGVMDELANLMDMHATHGGVQNVSLLLLCSMAKDATASRQALTKGYVAQIFRAMESTPGREVQFNGLTALRLIVDGGRGPRAALQEAATRAKVAHQHDAALCSLADDVLAMVTPRFKEVLCWHWQSGWCKLGPRCTYAHGPGDLRGGLS